MRTKALLLTAALSLAAAATSMAQAVYSVNIVGYINMTMVPGFNLIGNHLNNGTPPNRLDTLFPGAPEESQVLKFVGGNYGSDIYLSGAWLNSITGDPSTTTLSPGEGAFFFNASLSPHPVTFVGEVVPAGSVDQSFPPGFTLASSKIPADSNLNPVNNATATLAPGEEDQFLTFNTGTQNYDTALIFLNGEWLNSVTGTPATPNTPVGGGFFYFTASATDIVNWHRVFTPNN